MKIKIAYLISTLGTGGAEKQLVRTINLLDFDKFEVSLFVLTGVNELQNELDSHVKVVYLNFQSYINPINHLKLIKSIKQFNPHLLHSVMFASNLFSRIYKVFHPKVKVVNHIHGLGSWIKKPHIILDRLFLPYVNKIILVSEKSKLVRANREKYPIEKMQVIHNCVDTNLYKPARDNDNLSVVFGVACRLIPLKNVGFSIKIIKLLKNKGVNVKLKIAGDGTELNSLISLVDKLKMNEYVEFDGLVQDMPKFYNQIDYLISSSKIEDLPLTIVEALACGKVFISSNVGGISELTTETDSFLFNIEDDLNKISDEIIAFIASIDKKSANFKNREFVLKNFSEKNHKDSISQLYFELVKNGQ